MDFIFKWLVITILTLIIVLIIGSLIMILGGWVLSVATNMSDESWILKLNWYEFFKFSIAGSIIIGLYKTINEYE